jgi:hypothetical protein
LRVLDISIASTTNLMLTLRPFHRTALVRGQRQSAPQRHPRVASVPATWSTALALEAAARAQDRRPSRKVHPTLRRCLIGLGSWTATTALPTPIVANFAVAGTKVYYLAVPTLVAALSPSGISSWTPTFNPPGSWWASTCFAYENYLFCVTPGSDETYFVDIGQLTASSVEPNDPPPFSNPDFLGPAWSGSGGCSVSANGQSAGAPCFGGGIDWAVIFDCAAEAATSAGCKTTVVSELDTSYNYDMTIWYPCSQAPGPDANCCFQPTIGYDTPLFGWCISTGSNSFIISNPSPPPP